MFILIRWAILAVLYGIVLGVGYGIHSGAATTYDLTRYGALGLLIFIPVGLLFGVAEITFHAPRLFFQHQRHVTYKPAPCAWCHQSGRNLGLLPCRACGGYGSVLTPTPQRKCGWCDGTGRAWLNLRCSICDGNGWAFGRTDKKG